MVPEQTNVILMCCIMSLKNILKINDRHQIVNNADSHCPSCSKCNSFKRNTQKYLITRIRGIKDGVKVFGQS